MQHIFGRIEDHIIAHGSKSEHQAIVIRTRENERYVLRLKGSAAFDYSAFEKYKGAVVNIRGTVLAGNVLLVYKLSDIMPAGGLAPPGQDPFPG